MHQSFKNYSTFIFITIISFFSLFTTGYALNAPDAPTGVAASDGTHSGKVQVTWNAVTGASSYDVYRADMPAWTGTAPKRIASSVAGTLYNDTSAARGSRYYYWVKSISASGVSRYSNFDAGYRGKTGTKPAVPTDVSATDGTASGKVNITWDKTNNTLIYEIWRADIPAFLGGKIKKIGTSATTSYSDATVVAGNRYYYWVKARNSWGVSRYSLFDTGYIGTAASPLSAPTDISASERSVSGKVNISWRPISGALVYEVWRATKLVSEGGKPQRVGFLPGTSFDNTSTANNTNYYYWVKARDSWGSSRYSRPVSPGTSIGSGGDPNPSTPGDDCDTALPLAVNSSYSGSFVTDMDIHYFKITPSASGTLTVYTTGDTDTMGGILDDDCSLIEDDDDSGEMFNFNMSRTLAAGTYYIAATPALYGETGPYKLYLSFTGSGSSGATTKVNGNVTLPSSSPLNISEVAVEVLDKAVNSGSTGNFTIDVPVEGLSDATVMLAQRAGDSLPTVYLFSTLLPGENEIVLNKEETAIGLLMNGISHDYLTQAGTPETVKETIRQNGQAFIQRFIRMIEQDPYVLRVENLENVYDQTYTNAARACKRALQDMTSQVLFSLQGKSDEQLSGSVTYASPSQANQWRSISTATSGQPVSMLGLSGTLIVKPSDRIDDFVILEDTGNLGNINAGGKMTGSIQVENDSMLFAHFKVTDLVSGKLLQDLPNGFLNTAFGPNLLGPQGGWSTGYWASTALYNAEFQSVIVEIHTPGLLGGTWTEYMNGPSLALSCRTMYSSAVIPTISLLLPVSESRAKIVFDFMKDYGLFETPLDKWSAGDWGGGAWDFVKKIAEKKILTSVVEEYVKGIVTDPKLIAKYVSKSLVKFASGAKTFDLIGAGVDLGKLAADVISTHSKIEFQVIFPVSINNLTPTTLTKVAEEDDNPMFKLEGTGLESFTFGGVEYEASIYLESVDNDDDDIRHTIDSADITVNGAGTALEFQVPFSWSQVGSNAAGPIYVNLIHHFVDYNGINEVVRVELPEKAAEENFTIDLVSDLAINSLSTDKVSEHDELILYGKGFAAFFGNNKVYFIDHQNHTIEAEVDYGNETYLKVIVPENLEPGPLRVYVELNDKSKSNEKMLSMLPKMVTADPGDDTHFEDTLDVWLSQDQLYDIYYQIDDGAVKKASGFSPSITLDKTSHIYAYARATVNGVNYDSVTGNFFYYKCAGDEAFENGECVRDSSTDKLSFTVTVSMPSVERDEYIYNGVPLTLHTFRAGPRFLEWSVSDSQWVEEGGGVYGSINARIRIDPNTNEASGFIAGINSSQVGGIQFNRIPSVGTNRFAVHGIGACGHSAFATPIPGYDDWLGSCVDTIPASAGTSVEVTITGSLDAP